MPLPLIGSPEGNQGGCGKQKPLVLAAEVLRLFHFHPLNKKDLPAGKASQDLAAAP